MTLDKFNQEYHDINKGGLERAMLRLSCEGYSRGIDIGASTGIFTFPMHSWLSQPCEILAFEPDPERAKIITDAGLANIKVYLLALGREDTSATLFLPHNSLVKSEGDDRSIVVPVGRLDDYYKEIPTVIKMDVEGAEGTIFEGGKKFLNGQTRWVFEVSPFGLALHDGWKSARILEELFAHQYCVYEVQHHARHLRLILPENYQSFIKEFTHLDRFTTLWALKQSDSLNSAREVFHLTSEKLGETI